LSKLVQTQSDTGETKFLGERRNAPVRCRACRPVILVTASAALLNGITAFQAAWGAPFSQSFRDNLNVVCGAGGGVIGRPGGGGGGAVGTGGGGGGSGGGGRDPLFLEGSNLDQLCRDIFGDGPNVGSAFSSIPTGGSPQGMLAIEQRLQSSREAEEEKIEGRRGGQGYALRNTLAQREGGLQLPPAGGASPNVVYGVGSGRAFSFPPAPMRRVTETTASRTDTKRSFRR
jgi:hypothetical protein